MLGLFGTTPTRKRTTAARRKSTRKSTTARRTRVSDTMAVEAIGAQVGTPTLMSLATKRRSSKLGAGMPTLVIETKKVARAMGRSPPKRSAIKRRTTKKKSSAKKKACKPNVTASGRKTRRVRVDGRCVAFKGKAHKLALSLGQ
jgi:hypothetical protein